MHPHRRSSRWSNRGLRSYAYAAKNFRRVIQLFFAAYSLPFIAHVIVDPMMIVDSSLILTAVAEIKEVKVIYAVAS